MKINDTKQTIEKRSAICPQTSKPPDHMGTWSYDIENDMMLWSEALYRLHEVPASFVPTLPRMIGFSHSGTGQSPKAAFDLALSSGSGFQVQYPIQLLSGKLRWVKLTAHIYVKDGQPKRILGTIQDFTQIIDEKADPTEDVDVGVNGVPDFTSLDDILNRATLVAKGSGLEFALYCFTSTPSRDNNAFVPEGDVLIAEMFSRIKPIMNGLGRVLQLDGNTLVIVAECLRDENDVASLTSRLKAEFERPISTLEGEIGVPYSLDVFRDSGDPVVFDSPDSCGGPDNVDQARRCTDAHGRKGRLSKFNIEIRDAQKSDQFVVAYQPKVDFRNGTIAGFEALIRWQHPVKGLLEPSAFHQAFDDPQLEYALSNMILAKVVNQLTSWRDGNVEFKNVAVNLASGQLHESGFFERFVTMTEMNAILPSQLKLEIREDVLLGDADHIVSKTLNCIQQAGFSTAIDDFGRGHVRWRDISGFSVDRLKIDRSIVTNVLDDQSKRSLVKSIINLAHDLKLEVIAEGVETASVDRALKSWGCDFGQGFTYARPMLADAVPAFIDDWNARQDMGSHLHLIKNTRAEDISPVCERQ